MENLLGLFLFNGFDWEGVAQAAKGNTMSQLSSSPLLNVPKYSLNEQQFLSAFHRIPRDACGIATYYDSGGDSGSHRKQR